MSDDDPTLEDVIQRMDRLENRFVRLTEDFTQLRHEVNDIERKVERRT